MSDSIGKQFMVAFEDFCDHWAQHDELYFFVSAMTLVPGHEGMTFEAIEETEIDPSAEVMVGTVNRHQMSYEGGLAACNMHIATLRHEAAEEGVEIDDVFGTDKVEIEDVNEDISDEKPESMSEKDWDAAVEVMHRTHKGDNDV